MHDMKEVFSAAVIRRRVEELAAQIDEVYRGETIVAVCVLKGAFPFFSDLVRAMKTDVLIDFVRLASYGDRASSSEHVQITKDVEISLEGRHVLIVEDIVDTGRSMDFLMRGEVHTSCRPHRQKGTAGIFRAFRFRGL